MKISRKWLQDYVDVTLDTEALADRLTLLGLEIESIERPGEQIQGVRVGQILSIEQHPDADKLVVCKTEVGEEEPLQIVCGAKNMQVGDKVPTAAVGATLPGGFEIGRRKMRGIESQGMMCSGRELGISEDHAGLMILPEDMPLGEDITKALGLDDVVYEIEVTPNRNDWSSMIGVARELAALGQTTLRIPEVTLQEGDTPADSLSSVTIDAPDLCRRYIGRIIEGITVGPSPQWLAKRLVAAGQRPINNVVDVTNYVLLETGHPLHAFDYDTLAENRIVVRTAQTGERLKTLDGETHELNPEMLVIADASQPVALAGIMGGENSEVGEGTTTVFLESAWFDPISIRRTARSLNMTTEASQRFQRGADVEMAEYAADRAAQLLADVAGGTLAKGRIDAYPAPPQPRSIALRFARADRVLGVHIEPEQQRNYLTSLGFKVCDTDGEKAVFAVPSWRGDCTLEEDLIEEIARLHGYDAIAPALPSVRPTEHDFVPEEAVYRAARRRLATLGFTEVMNMTFGSIAGAKKAQIEAAAGPMVMLDNPMSENQAGMRTSLRPAILDTIVQNANRGMQQVYIFEVGPVFAATQAPEMPATQQTMLSIGLYGTAEAPHWNTTHRDVDIYDAKGIAEYVLQDVLRTTQDVKYVPIDSPGLSPGQAAEIRFKKNVLGIIGSIANPVLKAYDIDRPCCIVELHLERLVALRPAAHVQFTPVSPYPPSLRDLAVVVDTAVSAADLSATAQEAGGKYLRSVDIFDIYEGDPVPKGKRSIAFSLVFQSDEQTLNEKATQKAFDKILRQLNAKFGAELR